MGSNWVLLLLLHIASGLIPIGDQRGTDFLLSFMKNGYGNGKPYIIILTDDTANVDVTNHWTPSTSTHVITGGTSLKIELAQAIRYTDTTEQPEVKTVTLKSDVNITVYVMDHNTYSAEGYLAIPINYLSTRYIAVSYTETTYQPAVQVSAVEDNTEVTLTFNVAVGGTCGVGLHTDGDKMSFFLQSKETVTIFCTNDLTGTSIRSSKPVSVLSGHPCAIVPDNSNGLDMLMEMMVPIEALGRTFLLHDLAGRDSGAIYRVVATEDDTTFTTTTGKSATLQLGEFKDIDTQDNGEMCVNADKPVLVVMYGKSKNADTVVTIGDGFMSQVPPVDRFLSRYVFDASAIPDFTSYIATTLHNDLLVPARDTGFTKPSGCNFSVDVRSSSSSFTAIALGTDPFGAVAYGFMTAGAYGFPLGMVFDFDDCEGIPCKNGGTCTDMTYTFTCDCEPDYTGSSCETALKSSSSEMLVGSNSRTSSSDVQQESTAVASSTTDLMYVGVSTLLSSLSSSILPVTATVVASDTMSNTMSLSTSFTMQDSVHSDTILETASSHTVVESSLSSLSDFLTTDSLTIESLSSTATVPLSIDDVTSSVNLLPTSSQVTISTSPASTNILDMLSPTASLTKLDTSVCGCGCAVTLSNEEVEAVTEMIKKTLTVATHNLSRTLRKKTSIPDSRPSAVAVGFSGIIMIVITTLLLTATDLITLVRHVLGKSRKPQTARLTITVTRSDTDNTNDDIE